MRTEARLLRLCLLPAIATLMPIAGAAQNAETTPPQAESDGAFVERLGFGLHVGTKGVGLDVAYRALPWLSARLDGSYIGFGFRHEDTDLAFHLLSVGVIGDVYPFEDDGFHLSAGLGYFDLALTAETKTEDVEASVRSGPFGGYVGLGFGNVAAAEGLVGVFVDLGVVLSGAKVDSNVDSELDEVLRSVNIEPDDVKDGFLFAWPVISLGIAIRPER